MKITCLTIGSRGDVQPYIALCQKLNELGHTCSIATHQKFQRWIEENGVGFRPVAGDPAELIKHCTENGMSLSFWRNGVKNLGPWFDDPLKTSWEACQGSDLLIESPNAMAGVHIAQALNIPYIRAFTMPWTKTGVYPHAMAALGQYWAGWVNRLSYKLFDGITWLLIREKVNIWRQTHLKLMPTKLEELQLSQVPFLYNFSPAVVPKPSDWGHLVQVTGYWFMKKKTDEKIPEGLNKAIATAKAQGKKIVYIGFGSIIVPDPHKMTDSVVSAVKDSEVFAIVSGGWTAGAAEGTKKPVTQATTEAANQIPTQSEKNSDAADYMKRKIEELPDSMYYVDAVSHEALFPEIDAAFHHGGAGTTAASIRAGIPTLIHPFFGDQSMWAQRVEKLGVGIHVKSLTKQHIEKALKEATQDEKRIHAARELGKQVSSEQGVEKAIELIYDFMGSSRRLIEETRSNNLAKKTRASPVKLQNLRQLRVRITELMGDFSPIQFVIKLRQRRSPKFKPSSNSRTAVKIINSKGKYSYIIPRRPQTSKFLLKDKA